MTWFPQQPEALTAGWLTDRLRASGAISEAAVLSFDCRPIGTHNGMTGALVRLTLRYDVAEAHAPRSLIAKFSQPDPGFTA